MRHVSLRSLLCALALLVGCGQEAPEANVIPVDEPTTTEDESPESSPPSTPQAAALEVHAEEVSETLLTRLHAELDETAATETVIRASRRVSEADGTTTVFALYELSALFRCVEQTVEEGAPRQRAMRDCRSQMEYQTEDGERHFEECTELHLVRAVIAAPAEGAEPGAIELTADQELGGGCILERVVALRLADVDADRKVEVELDYIGRSVDRGRRSQFSSVGQVRTWEIREGDTLAERFVADRQVAPELGEHNQATLTTFSDENEDGHPDLVVRTIEYDVASDVATCGFSEESGWPEDASAAGTEGGCVIREDSTVTWLYEPDSDRYRRQTD